MPKDFAPSEFSGIRAVKFCARFVTWKGRKEG